MAEDVRGQLDMHAKREMWEAFGQLTKWVIILSVVVLALMAIFLV
jgi:hypothetical protein